MAEVLRALRIERDLTQEEAAIRCGIGWKNLAHLESGYRTERLRVTQLIGIVRGYGITITQFFYRVDEWTRTHRTAKRERREYA